MGFVIPLALGAAGIASGIGTAAGATTALGTLAGVGMAAASGLGALGTVTQMNAANEQAKATQQAMNYQSQVAQNQATLYNQQAQQQMAVGQQQEYNAGLETRGQVGAIEAGQAASGIDVNTGSALDVRQSAQQLGNLNEATIQSNAARQAWGSQQAATSALAQAGLYQQEAAQAPIAGQYAAIGSMLSGASGLARQYQSWQLAAGPSIGGAPTGGSSTGGAVDQGTFDTNAVLF